MNAPIKHRRSVTKY